jgi:hypothetical protein
MLELTDWARDILTRSDAAARRFNPDARIRLARQHGSVQATLTDEPLSDDQTLTFDGVTIFVEPGLEGLIDIEEPHDRVVLKSPGSPWNDRSAH